MLNEDITDLGTKMEVIHGIENVKALKKPVMMTLGSFDGVHLAHQRLIRMLTGEAKKTKGLSVLITFDPLPRSVVHLNDIGLVLTSTDHKLRILEGLGLDVAVIIKFDKEFAAITAEKFLENIILGRFRSLRKIIIGPRAHFGHNAEGDAEYIRKFGEKHGFEVETTDEMVLNDAVVSSSVIRKLVRSGELDTAEAFLGRKYSLFGSIISGRRIGRKLGFPTANIDPKNEVHPPSGVYAVQIKLDHNMYPGVLNIGYRPTVRKRDDLEVAIETHIIGFTGRIYGRSVEIIFHKILRQEKHFADKQALIAQIRRDVEEATRYLSAK